MVLCAKVFNELMKVEYGQRGKGSLGVGCRERRIPKEIVLGTQGVHFACMYQSRKRHGQKFAAKQVEVCLKR